MKMEYEEIEFVCEVCGKKVKRVARKGKGRVYLCQNCAKKLVEGD